MQRMVDIRAALPPGWFRGGQCFMWKSIYPISFRTIDSVSTAAAYGRKPKQGDQDGSFGSTHRQEQHQEYHKISTSWNVPRTSLSAYPEEAQHVIRNNLGRKSRRSSSSFNSIKSGVDMILKVLQYEASCGFVDAQGKTGQCFSQWLDEALQRCLKDLSDSGLSDSALLFLNLSKEFRDYDDLPVNARRDLVLKMEMAATKVGHSLQPHPHPMRSTRYALAEHRGDSRQEDLQAEEAHEEETAPIPSHVSTQILKQSVAVDSQNAEDSASLSAPKLDVDVDYHWIKNQKKIKPETIAFRESFAKAALAAAKAAAAIETLPVNTANAGKQRTSQWFALRERRLTASAFSKALGFFDGDRNSLWEEKVGLKPPFGGNEATQWGTRMESRALDTYQTLTGQQVEGCMFRVKHDDPPHSWLGASPDGLMGGLGISDGVQPETASAAGFDTASAFKLSPESLNGPGILEIKCPYNRGHPEHAAPPSKAIWYYMPQLQGLMDIFDREWCVLYVWTINNGSVAFLITRDREYWAAAFAVLADFWWSYVVPARQAYEQGASPDEVDRFRPPDNHPGADELRAWSKRLANAAPALFFKPSRS